MLGVLSLTLPLDALIALAWRGGPVLLIAPAMALMAALLAGDPLLATLTQRFMPALGGFVVAYFPLFLLGAVFGTVMEVSGAADTLARAITRAVGPGRAITAVVAACALLTYGGVSLFVVAFAVFPLARALFADAGTDPRLIPAAIALGAFTFTMSALPGTPAIQNAIPMPYFGTDLFAAPGLGLIAAAIMVGGGLAYLSLAAGAAWPAAAAPPRPPGGAALPVAVALAPILCVLGLNLGLSRLVFPALDLGFLADPAWGGVRPAAVTGLWSILISLTAAIGLLLMLARHHMPQGHTALSTGAAASLLPLFNTASLVGFGAVVAGLPAFDALRAVIDDLPGGPAESLALSASLLAGITGSASGGMSIALAVLGESHLARSEAAGLAPAVLHRVVALATGGLDALPHNGAVITLLTIANMTHREAYGPIFVVAVAIPVVALLVVLALVRATGGV